MTISYLSFYRKTDLPKLFMEETNMGCIAYFQLFNHPYKKLSSLHQGIVCWTWMMGLCQSFRLCFHQLELMFYMHVDVWHLTMWFLQIYCIRWIQKLLEKTGTWNSARVSYQNYELCCVTVRALEITYFNLWRYDAHYNINPSDICYNFR
jgi:hypothetical protein